MRRRWPALAISDDLRCLFEPGAGFLEVDRCVMAHAEVARMHGADLIEHQRVLGWSADDAGVRVTTEHGRISARALVVTAGPWSASLLADLELPLRVHRVHQLWFAAGDGMALERGMPSYAFDLDGHFVYGFPRWGRWGAKICEHAPGPLVDPAAPTDLSCSPTVPTPVATAIARYLPQVRPELVAHRPCYYTMTPDENFLVDVHPQHRNVCVAAGFSGHGFKFASVIGEVLADLAMYGATELPIDFLRLARFGIGLPDGC